MLLFLFSFNDLLFLVDRPLVREAVSYAAKERTVAKDLCVWVSKSLSVDSGSCKSRLVAPSIFKEMSPLTLMPADAIWLLD